MFLFFYFKELYFTSIKLSSKAIGWDRRGEIVHLLVMNSVCFVPLGPKPTTDDQIRDLRE